jgi:hypothetical protein
MTPTYLVAQGPIPLMVNDAGDGDAPNSTFKQTVVTGILWSYYGRLCEHFKGLGHQVYYGGYDWRLGVKAAAQELYAPIIFWSNGEPIYMIGHSLGGMVGRGILRIAHDENTQGHFVRLLTLGTPHHGSLSIPRLWGHLGSFWSLLYALFYPTSKALALYAGISSAANVLDEVIASLVSTYSLLPQPDSPCLAGGYDYAAVMNPNTYAVFNGYLKPERFAAAQAEHVWLADSIYPQQQYSVVSRGLATPYRVRDVNRLQFSDGYDYSLLGDGTVDTASADCPNVANYFVEGIEHQALPYDPKVLPLYEGLLIDL